MFSRFKKLWINPLDFSGFFLFSQPEVIADFSRVSKKKDMKKGRFSGHTRPDGSGDNGMKCPFCYLEKDQKTYQYVMEYLGVMKDGQSTVPLDITIQRKEIERHMERNGISPSDQPAISAWIEANSANFRSYLNSLKMVALFLFYIKKTENGPDAVPLPFELFMDAIGYWNERKIEMVDSIFI